MEPGLLGEYKGDPMEAVGEAGKEVAYLGGLGEWGWPWGLTSVPVVGEDRAGC